MLSVRRTSRKTTAVTISSHLPWQLKEKISFQNITKSSIKTTDIYSLQNTGRLNNGNLNDSS